MSTDSGPDPASRPQPEAVDFEGDRLLAVRLEGEGIAIPVREICQALGLDLDTQSARLRDPEVLAQGLRMVRVRYGDRIRTLVAILHKYIPFWLATISPQQVKDTVRPKLVRYQIELVDLLASLYGGEVQATLPASTAAPSQALQRRFAEALQEVRLAREALLSMQQHVLAEVQAHEVRLTTVEGLLDQQVVTVGGQLDDIRQQLDTHTTITGPQQEAIKRSIQRIAARYAQRTGRDIYARLFSQFRLDLGTSRYDALPAGRYADALTWLQARATEYLPDDPDALPPLQDALL